MTHPRPDRPWLLHVAVALALLLLPPGGVLADTDPEADPRGWSLRVYAAAIDFDLSSGGNAGLREQAHYGIAAGGGVGVNAEYRFSRRFGLDLGVLAGAGVDLAARTNPVGPNTTVAYDTVSMTPLTAGLDIHLTPDSRVDLYFCPLLAWVQYGNFTASTGLGNVRTEIDLDDDFSIGASLGLGVPFRNQRWSFTANVTYLDSAMSGSSFDTFRADNQTDVTMLGAGVGYRF